MRSVILTIVSIVLFAFATRTVSALPVGSRHLANENVDATNAAAIDGVSFIYKRQLDDVSEALKRATSAVGGATSAVGYGGFGKTPKGATGAVGYAGIGRAVNGEAEAAIDPR